MPKRTIDNCRHPAPSNSLNKHKHSVIFKWRLHSKLFPQAFEPASGVCVGNLRTISGPIPLRRGDCLECSDFREEPPKWAAALCILWNTNRSVITFVWILFRIISSFRPHKEWKLFRQTLYKRRETLKEQRSTNMKKARENSGDIRISQTCGNVAMSLKRLVGWYIISKTNNKTLRQIRRQCRCR